MHEGNTGIEVRGFGGSHHPAVEPCGHVAVELAYS